MKRLECREVRDRLIDFSEGEMDDAQHAAVQQHLDACPGCRQELRGIEGVRNALASEPVPDPGVAFWEQFPEKVWRAYQAEQVTVNRTERTAGIRDLIEWLRLTPRGAVVAAFTTLAIIVGAVLLFLPAPSGMPGIASLQARIQSGDGLALLAQRTALGLPAGSQLGFSPPAGKTGFFRIGHEFAQSLAYMAGGDSDSARRHLSAIAALLGDVAPPALTRIARDTPTHAQIAALEEELGRLATGTHDLVLFQAGGQMVNLALAVAAHDDRVLHDAVSWVRQLRRDLASAGAAPGALMDLDTLAGLLGEKTISEQVYAQAARLIRNIQLVLG